MKFFADTAEIAEIRELAEEGLLDGVTTNPSLVHKSGRDFLEVVKEIAGVVEGPVSAEVVALDHDGMMREAEVLRKIADIRLIYDNYDFATQILAASIRHPVHVLEAAKLGADVMTAPPAVIRQLFRHPLTDAGLKAFLADWEKTGQKIG